MPCSAQTYEERVAQEEQERLRHEQEIARLEAEEAELLRNLERTQNLQKNAYAELEVALEV